MALALDDPERAGPAGEEVHPSVLHPLEHLLDLAGAANLAQAVVGEPDDSELPVERQALVHHRLVALLEDVQRDDLFRQRDEPEREQRKVAYEAVRHQAECRSLSATSRATRVRE